MQAVQYLFKAWSTLSPLPGGKQLFFTMLGRAVPYTGSLPASVLELRPGYCKVRMKDKRKVRNHLNSVHAMALANLTECCSGLCTLMTLGTEYKGILAGFQIIYLKKARGELHAICEIQPFQPDQSNTEVEIPVKIIDASGETVVEAVAKWNIKKIK